MKIAITAVAAIAGAATASPFFANSDAQGVGSMAPNGVVSTMTIDISGINSMELYGDALNVVSMFNLGANAHVIGLGYDVTISTFGISWLEEPTIAFENSDFSGGVFLAPGTGAVAGTGSFSSGGIIDLVGLGFDFLLNADGTLRVEFFETDWNDESGLPDAVYLAGSTLSVQYVAVPAPGALAMLGLGGLVAGRRRR